MKIESIQLYYYPPRIQIRSEHSNHELSVQMIDLPQDMTSWEQFILKNSLILKHYKQQIPNIIKSLSSAQINISSKQFVQKLTQKPHTCQILSVNINTHHVVSSSFDCNASAIDVQQSNFQLFEHRGPVFCTALQSHIFATGSLDGAVRVFDINQNKQVSVLPNSHRHPCLSIQLDQNRCVYGLESGQVTLADVQSQQFVKLMRHQAEAVQIQLKGQICYTAGFDGCVFRNDLRECHQSSRLTTGASTGRFAQLSDSFVVHQAPITVLRQSESFLLSCSERGIVLNDVRNMRRPLYTEQPCGQVLAGDLSWRGYISFSDSTQTKFLDGNFKQTLRFIPGSQFIQFLNPGGGTNVIVCQNNKVFRVENGAMSTVSESGAEITALGVEKEGQRIAVGRADGTVGVWGV